MSEPAILRPRELKTNDRGNGARTTPLVTRKCGSTSMINGITAFDPGAAIGLHKHNCEESVMILDGQAIAEIDGVRYPLSPNDTTWISCERAASLHQRVGHRTDADLLGLCLDRCHPHDDRDWRGALDRC